MMLYPYAGLVIITGSIGTGKTTLTKQISTVLKNPEIIDDQSYMTVKSVRDIECSMSMIRHTQIPIIVTTTYLRFFERMLRIERSNWENLPKHTKRCHACEKLFEYLERPTIQLIFTSYSPEMISEYPAPIPISILRKFKDDIEFAFTKNKRKRPYLLVHPHYGATINWYRI